MTAVEETSVEVYSTSITPRMRRWLWPWANLYPLNGRGFSDEDSFDFFNDNFLFVGSHKYKFGWFV